MNQTIEQLNAAFAIPDRLWIEAGAGRLPRVVVSGPAGAGSVYLHGAHVATWQPAGHDPVLWLSERANYADGQAIRGGVPVCFPWFGPKADDPDAPAHGTVRTKAWELVHTTDDPTGVTATLETTSDDWGIRLSVTFGQTLTTALHIRNDGDTEASCEAALHTYFAVADAKAVHLTGLEHTDYLDKVDHAARKNQGTDPIRFTGETDRVYLDTEADVTLHDPVLGRVITVRKAGSRSTVVWNPWIDKSARMADFGDDEWTGMCCIETANVGEQAMRIEPGASSTMSTTIEVASA